MAGEVQIYRHRQSSVPNLRTPDRTPILGKIVIGFAKQQVSVHISAVIS